MPTTTNYNRGAVVLLPFPFSSSLVRRSLGNLQSGDLAQLDAALRTWLAL